MVEVRSLYSRDNFLLQNIGKPLFIACPYAQDVKANKVIGVDGFHSSEEIK